MRYSLFAALACFSAMSCSNVKFAPVSGRVSVGGVPVESGMILFTPENGPTATGEIAKGRYTLTTTVTGDGALIGKHKVTIQAIKAGPMVAYEPPKSLEEEVEMSRKPKAKAMIPGEVTFVVPERYSNPKTTDLEKDVVSGTNTIDFDLPAK